MRGAARCISGFDFAWLATRARIGDFFATGIRIRAVTRSGTQTGGTIVSIERFEWIEIVG
ncbi:hypothetical protein PTKU46_04490 [Paraburkholderia terrae]